MDNLAAVTREEIRKYAGNGEGLYLRLYPILDDTHQVYTVIAIRLIPDQERSAGVVIMARIEADFVIIEADNTDAPLLEALRQQGIPREQIVLAYAGETMPEETPISGD